MRVQTLQSASHHGCNCLPWIVAVAEELNPRRRGARTTPMLIGQQQSIVPEGPPKLPGNGSRTRR